MTTKAGSFMSYDFADISEPGNEMADEELITTPEQSSTGKREYRWTERDRELNRFPMAMISKLFFFAGCAMFLWMSIDNLYWTNEARTIPQTVLQSTDDTTWRNFRSRQSGMSNGNRKLQYLRAGGSRWLQVIGTTVWQNLAFSKQVAAATLGYNEQTWNERGSVSSDIITWDSLTSGQKEAAQWLGYNQTLWDSTHGFSNRASINNVDPSNTDWGNFLWTELPTEIQTDAAKLGYNQEKWNNGERAYADNLFWDELTSEQQQAATALGYSKATWNVYSSIGSNLTAATAVPSSSGNSYRTSVSGVTSSTTSISVISGSGTQQNSSASKENRTSATDWQLYKWSELPSNIKAAAVVMGFDKELWNKKAGVTTDKYKWEELSSQQQQAASLVFGYTEQSWDAAYNSQWQSYAWDDLPANIQADAKILGYNKTLWNDGAKVATGSYRWDQLTQEQQKAAFNVLGFTAKTWNSDKNGNSNIKNGGGGRDESHGGADDDYVFSVQKAKEKVWISKYQIVYFVAALCFVLVGILDMIRERRSYHILMTIAGCFAVTAAMMVEENLNVANILHCFAWHFFVFQGVTMFFFRTTLRELLPRPSKNALWLADFFFTLGALLKVVLSYVYFKEKYRTDLGVARADAFAAMMFFLSASVYVVTTPVLFCRNTKDKPYLE